MVLQFIMSVDGTTVAEPNLFGTKVRQKAARKTEGRPWRGVESSSDADAAELAA
jgi:hypothetical protein